MPWRGSSLLHHARPYTHHSSSNPAGVMALCIAFMSLWHVSSARAAPSPPKAPARSYLRYIPLHSCPLHYTLHFVTAMHYSFKHLLRRTEINNVRVSDQYVWMMMSAFAKGLFFMSICLGFTQVLVPTVVLILSIFVVSFAQ